MSNGTRRRYSEEFKADTVRLIEEQGYSTTEASRRLGIDRSVLNRWRRQGSVRSKDAGSDKREDERDTELRRLREEVRKLRIEREILKNPPRAASVPHL